MIGIQYKVCLNIFKGFGHRVSLSAILKLCHVTKLHLTKKCHINKI